MERQKSIKQVRAEAVSKSKRAKAVSMKRSALVGALRPTPKGAPGLRFIYNRIIVLWDFRFER